jgi:hypothetical protein
MLVIVSTLKIIIIVTIIITVRVCFCEQIISYVYLLYTLSLLETTTKLNITPKFATDGL